jgi:hypothetical protein
MRCGGALKREGYMLRIGRMAPGVALAGMLCAHAAGQAPPSYGLDFVTVGAPGNRVPNQTEAPNFYPPIVPPGFHVPGRVDYEFRVTRTEVNVTQWFEYVRAYAPFHQGSLGEARFTSDWIDFDPGQGHRIKPGADKYSANMSWDHAARYVNWLENGKVNQSWAFESGVYDLSNPRAERNPEARFWIPSLDEWIKAVYYDPDRYGPGEEGYWKHPGSGDTPLVSGYPWQGGQTNGGISGLRSGGMEVGSYPHVPGPWGVLDASGGVREWTDSLADPTTDSRVRLGSHAGSIAYTIDDRIDRVFGASAWVPDYGFRVAAVIPSPSTAVVLALGWWFLFQRRRLS